MFQYAALKGIAANRGFDYTIPSEDPRIQIDNYGLLEAFELTTNKNIGWIESTNVEQERFFHFDQELFDKCPNEISLLGFFQSERYFSNIKDSIKEDFTFLPNILEPVEEMAKQLNHPIALHVRRTDYLTNSENHANLPLDYYRSALAQFDDTRQVIVFSDDPKWCMEQEIFSNDRFIVSESEDNAIDMCLMTKCSGHIIANSSFSWWGAWLADSKKVIAPSLWFGPNNKDKTTRDLIPERWHII